MCSARGRSGASPPGGQPAPHAVTIQYPLFTHNTASKAQDLAVLGSVGKGTAGGVQNRKVRHDLMDSIRQGEGETEQRWS